jgi:glycosyltransferase involved in cell wall biosynthesis
MSFQIPQEVIEESHKTSVKEVLWSGHIYDMSGYAKANREIILRLCKDIKIRLFEHDHEPRRVNRYLIRYLDGFKKTFISEEAPFVRFYTPLREKSNRHKICFTMMETQGVHKNFVDLLNMYYDEVWTPTQWGIDMFRRSGTEVPCRIVPLGVDETVYKPGPSMEYPACTRILPDNAVKYEIPQGFIFTTVFRPTFRKAPHVILPAFEKAFADDPDTCLVLNTSVHPIKANKFIADLVRRYCNRAKVYVLNGNFTEEEMVANYRSSDAYLAVSLGEGWNLPMTEAAACGLPVIASDNSAHTRILNDEYAYMVKPDGYSPFPRSVKICRWYEDMPFAYFNKPAIDDLIDKIRHVRNNPTEAKAKAAKLSDRVRTKYTWDKSAKTVLEHLNNPVKLETEEEEGYDF